jgi:hypothetical protein
VIFAPVMRLLEDEVRKAGRSEPLSYYHAHWTRDGAPLLDELGAVIDHVEAHSTGGATIESNLATSAEHQSSVLEAIKVIDHFAAVDIPDLRDF